MAYFDHNATTPLSAAAREVWLATEAAHWHNPSSLYRDAAKARIRLDTARDRLAAILETRPDQIVFTSGATESANAVLRYLAMTAKAGSQLWLNPTEHPCVLDAAKLFFGDRIQWLELDRDGRVKVDRLPTPTAASSMAAVVAMAANNETGVINPWRKIAERCVKMRIPFVCDAAQWLGKLPAGGLGLADWTFGSAHKFGGPKGTGFLKIPAAAKDFSIQLGGAQENAHRGGTENLSAVRAMLAALEHAEHHQVMLEAQRLKWREHFERRLCIQLPGTKIVAERADRLWNTSFLILPSGDNTRWVSRLDQAGFQVSTGSACATGKEGPSHVLAALGYSPEEARRAIRLSASWETTEADWDALLETLARLAPDMEATSASVVRL